MCGLNPVDPEILMMSAQEIGQENKSFEIHCIDKIPSVSGLLRGENGSATKSFSCIDSTLFFSLSSPEITADSGLGL